MSKKIGRNDPCPCGSGKKYKHCCLGRSKVVTGNQTPIKQTPITRTPTKQTPIIQASPKSEKSDISMLAIMRFEQKLQEKPEGLEQISKQFEEYSDLKDISFKDFILESWNFNKLKKMGTSEIIEKLKSMNVDFEIERFKEQAQNYISAIQLAEDHYYTQNFQAQGKDEDFIWLAIIELWKRIIPEKYNMEMIDDLIQDGYDDIESQNYKDGMEKWEKAWNIIVNIVTSHIKSVTDADKFIPVLTQCIFNWCQDFEMELANAALEDASFHQKRIKYCQDFRRVFPYSDKSIIKNMLKAEAESRAELGILKQ